MKTAVGSTSTRSLLVLGVFAGVALAEERAASAAVGGTATSPTAETPSAQPENKKGEESRVDEKGVGEKADDRALLAEDEITEGPRRLPRRYGVVVESSLGALGFIGGLGNVAPPGLLLRLHTGVEIFRWLMPFAEGDLAMTDTSRAQDGTKSRAFPIYSFGGGLRFTLRPTERFGLFLQASVGAAKAEVPARALAVLGYRDAEALGMYFGGRLGLEWYQLDRHLALALHGGVRDNVGFKKTVGGGLPLGVDGVLALRYAF